MGTVIAFPSRSGSRPPKPNPKPQLALKIADDPPGSPALEFALGFQGGEFAANYRVTTHAEFQALIAARRSGPVSFLRETQRCAFIQREPAAAAAPLSELSAYLYGRHGGGVHGPYAHGYRAACALIEPFVERVH